MSKKNLVWGIILFVIFGIALVLFFIFVGDLIAFIAIDSGAIAVITIWAIAILAAGFGSHYLLAKYRKGSDDKGVLPSIFYFISYIPFGVTIALGFIFYGIIKLLKELMTPAPDYRKKCEAKDEHGNIIKLKQEYEYGKQYKDEQGNRWITDDDGKTFKRG